MMVVDTCGQLHVYAKNATRRVPATVARLAATARVAAPSPLSPLPPVPFGTAEPVPTTMLAGRLVAEAVYHERIEGPVSGCTHEAPRNKRTWRAKKQVGNAPTKSAPQVLVRPSPTEEPSSGFFSRTAMIPCVHGVQIMVVLTGLEPEETAPLTVLTRLPIDNGLPRSFSALLANSVAQNWSVEVLARQRTSFAVPKYF